MRLNNIKINVDIKNLKDIKNIHDPEVLYDILQKSTDPEGFQVCIDFLFSSIPR